MSSTSVTSIIWGHLTMIHRHKMCSHLRPYSRRHKSIKIIHLLELVIRWVLGDLSLSMGEARINSSSIMFLNKNSHSSNRSLKVRMLMLSSMEWIRSCRINRFRLKLKLDCKKIWIKCLIYLKCLSGPAGHKNLNICLILFKIKGRYPNLMNDLGKKTRKSCQKRF